MRLRLGRCFRSTHRAESAIQREDWMPAMGPQKVGKGNSPRSFLMVSRSSMGWV